MLYFKSLRYKLSSCIILLGKDEVLEELLKIWHQGLMCFGKEDVSYLKGITWREKENFLKFWTV